MTQKAAHTPQQGRLVKPWIQQPQRRLATFCLQAVQTRDQRGEGRGRSGGSIKAINTVIHQHLTGKKAHPLPKCQTVFRGFIQKKMNGYVISPKANQIE